MITIVPATVEHAQYVGEHLRADDLAEVLQFGAQPVPALIDSITGSVEAWTALDDGTPITCWGVAPWTTLVGGVGCPWLLSTQGVERHKRRFMEESRAGVVKMHALFPKLETLVDARYTRAIRWLEWLGFAVLPGDKFRAVVMGE